ncbi:hypothetical protein EHQ53_05785 [Leptospira langatensis]|uniref:Uncharacterized protein n=1 Tax=Leptospira langatensis TaxID=2484983 RepID=A0A5F1ZVX1_9LEPT|nr:hypothetical protein EHO57_06620 [Leptospira langatensis]TGL42406.1 hypothetical protein EHQ53_05785 [Leptospira langatensis]
MFITAENIRTGEVRTFLGKERILVPDSKQMEATPSLSAHWETVEECLDLRKYSKFFYVTESEGTWKRGEVVLILTGYPYSSESEQKSLLMDRIDSYRVLGIFLEKE